MFTTSVQETAYIPSTGTVIFPVFPLSKLPAVNPVEPDCLDENVHLIA
jgi:hypothetical protein